MGPEVRTDPESQRNEYEPDQAAHPRRFPKRVFSRAGLIGGVFSLVIFVLGFFHDGIPDGAPASVVILAFLLGGVFFFAIGSVIGFALGAVAGSFIWLVRRQR